MMADSGTGVGTGFAQVRGKLSAIPIDRKDIGFFDDDLKLADDDVGVDGLMAQLLMHGLAPSIGGIGGGAIAASTAKAAVDAAGGNAANPGGFAEAMDALGVAGSTADRSRSWRAYVEKHIDKKFEWREGPTGTTKTASMTEMRVELERAVAPSAACIAIHAAVGSLAAISAGRYQLQVVATEEEIATVKGKTITMTIGTYTGASHRFEEEKQLVPASFWNNGSHSLTPPGALAVNEYIKIAAFASDPDRSFRIMNDKGQLSKCLTKNQATAWVTGTMKSATSRMTALENYRRHLQNDGTTSEEAYRPFVVIGSFALFAK